MSDRTFSKQDYAYIGRMMADAYEYALQRGVRFAPSVGSPNSRLEEALQNMIDRANYVCAHRYGVDDPVGTREVAISDLRKEIGRAVAALKAAGNSANG